MCASALRSQFVAPFMIQITKQQQKTQPFDNNWFDFGGRESLVIFLAVTCKEKNLWARPHAHTNTIPLDSYQRKRTKQNYQFSREQTYKSNTNIAAAVGNSTMFTVSLPNIMWICDIYAHPVFIFSKWHGIARALGVRLFLGEMHMGLRALLDLGSWVRGPLPRMPGLFHF